METSGHGRGASQIRAAEMRDAAAITAVINAAFRHAERFLLDSDRIDFEKVRELLQAGVFLVADNVADNAADNAAIDAADLGSLCGCVYVEPSGNRSYLGLLAVHPQHQKSRLGSKLMDAAEDFCAKAGSRFMDLQMVNLRKELPGFYLRRGYVHTATAPFTPRFNTNLPSHFVKMSKPLTWTLPSLTPKNHHPQSPPKSL